MKKTSLASPEPDEPSRGYVLGTGSTTGATVTFTGCWTTGIPQNAGLVATTTTSGCNALSTTLTFGTFTGNTFTPPS